MSPGSAQVLGRIEPVEALRPVMHVMPGFIGAPKGRIKRRILHNMIYGIPLRLPGNQNVRSKCLCGLSGPYLHARRCGVPRNQQPALLQVFV